MFIAPIENSSLSPFGGADGHSPLRNQVKSAPPNGEEMAGSAIL